MPILKRQLNLRPVSSGGRNFLIDFKLLPILPIMAVVFYAICKKSSGRYRAHMRPDFSFFAGHNFLWFYSFEYKNAPPQNVVSTHTSNIPHMVNFLSLLKEKFQIQFSGRLFDFIAAWILLFRFTARLLPSKTWLGFNLKIKYFRLKRITLYD